MLGNDATRRGALRPGHWFERLRGAERQIVHFEKVLCIVALLVMALSTVVSVAARNLGLAVPNYAELGLAALVPLTLIGGAACTYLGSHIAVEIVQIAPSRLLRRGAELVSSLGVLIFVAIYLRSGMILIAEFWMTGDKLLDLGTPLWFLASMFPIAMLLIAFHTIMRLLATIFAADATADEEWS